MFPNKNANKGFDFKVIYTKGKKSRKPKAKYLWSLSDNKIFDKASVIQIVPKQADNPMG
jgi:hypothetical protein